MRERTHPRACSKKSLTNLSKNVSPMAKEIKNHVETRFILYIIYKRCFEELLKFGLLLEVLSSMDFEI